MHSETDMHRLQIHAKHLLFFFCAINTVTPKTGKLTAEDLDSTFRSPSRLQRVSQLLRNLRCFNPVSRGFEKCCKVTALLAFALMRQREVKKQMKKSSLNTQREVACFPRKSGGGTAQRQLHDLARRAGITGRLCKGRGGSFFVGRGGAHRSKPPISFPCPNAHFLFLPLYFI